jgi:ABC-type nickel/cobalt efflux system permease component RcnA
MKQTKHVLKIGSAVLLAMVGAVPAAEAHHRGISSFGVSHRNGNYGHSNYGDQPYYVHDDHSHHYRHSRSYSDRYYQGDSYGIGGDCGFLHCHTAMPWG